MHANVNIESNSWKVPPDDIIQVADPRSKKDQDEPEELLYPGSGDGHNWRSIIFSLLVIGLVISGIVTAIYLLGYVDELLYWSGRRMQLEQLLAGDLASQRLPPAWVDHTHLVFQADDGALSVLDTANNNVSLLVTNHTLRQLNVKSFQCSQDLRYVLLQHTVKQIFRQSYTAHYTVYDVSNDHHIPLRLAHAPKVVPTPLQYASWLGNTTALLMIADNDIYARASPQVLEDTRITSTGQNGVFYNGVADWLYQEEILSSPEAVWPAPDGSTLLFASFNDSLVRTMSYPWFTFGSIVAPGAASAAFFPESRTVRYPTPGTANPEVKLWVVDIRNTSDLTPKEVRPPAVLEDTDYYLTSADWVGTDNLMVAAVWMRRAQNLSIISVCSPPNWTCVETHAERAPDDSWLDLQAQPLFAPGADSFLLLASVAEDMERFTHVKHVTRTQTRTAVLSHGRYEVTKILSWDTVNHVVYYLGTHEREPGQQHLYVVRDPSTDDPRRLEPQCVTCGLQGLAGPDRDHYVNCTHFTAITSPFDPVKGVEHYVLECEGPGLPLGGVHVAATHRLLRLLHSTMPARAARLSQLALPTMRSFEVPLPQGLRAQVQLLLPPSWREELRDAAFPVLVEVNGRPGSRTVTDRFSVHWGTYMSSRFDVVYVRLDARGARGQSKRGLHRKLGGPEVQDQISVVRYLLDSLTYMDRTRVGLWGWGYGGYVTAMVLGSQQNVFKCGIAVSPVADWLYYNSAFTERVMGLPSDNVKGYVEADATQRARYIPSHSLYLLHGLADVSAPFLHGVTLAKALTQEGVVFRYQSYANEGHKLDGVIEHVYKSMEDYLIKCLSLDEDADRPGQTS